MVPELARFTQDRTNVQSLFDHIDAYLIQPILSGQPVHKHGLQRLDELLTTNDWSALDEGKDVAEMIG